MNHEIQQIADSIACCGLICRLCHLSSTCDGCRSGEESCCGLRKSRQGCYQYNCCSTKGISGCWECNDAPCAEGMFGCNHDVRLRAFVAFIREHGKYRLAECVYENMRRGVLYGHGKDYDGLGSIDAVTHLLLQSRAG